MKAINFKQVEIRSPRWNNYKKPTLTENNKWGNQCCFVILKDYDGNEYDWMPTYNELKELNTKMQEMEKINSDKAREHVQR